MTQKDREFLDEVFYQMRDGGTQIINDVSKSQLAQLFDLANRLLTERENAEIVYKFDPAADGVRDEFTKKDIQTHWFPLSADDLTPVKGIKGAWIADGEAE